MPRKRKGPPRVTQFTKWLNGELEAAGISRTTLAERSGVGRSSVSQLANGVRKPSRMTVSKIAVGLQTDISEAMYAAGFVPDDPTAAGADPKTEGETYKPPGHEAASLASSSVADSVGVGPRQVPSRETVRSYMLAPIDLASAGADELKSVLEATREQLLAILRDAQPLSEEIGLALRKASDEHIRITKKYEKLNGLLEALDVQCAWLTELMKWQAEHGEEFG